MQKKIFFLASILLIGLIFIACNNNSVKTGPAKVLVFSKTAGYRHASIPKGIAAIKKLGTENGFEVDATEDAASFNEENLKQYATIIFLCTTGNVLDGAQEAAFERYIQAGGGYVGVHAAADTEYDWGWYGRLVGGYFLDHPGIHDSSPNVQEGVFNVVDATNIATKHLPNPWKRTDEFYSYKNLNPDNKVLLTIDESSYQGGHKMGDHPMSWYHDFDGGRSFYTALGHTDESYTEDNFTKHLLGGIQYAIGKNQVLNYSKAKSQIPPEADRFVKKVLAMGEFYEPTEMTILPNLDILIAQRRGEIMMYKNETQKVKQVGFLNAYFKTSTPGVNAEEGVLGLAKDPNFSKNNWIYIFYSPIDTSVNRLSRFEFKNDTLDLTSEKIILQFYSQREICCHTGGSIAFGPDGLLYLSAGDNSTPFNEPGQKFVNNGYAPLNDEPGHLQYDARRSSGNSNDLRGKILRIKLKDDGSYDIPEGNLYPKGTPKTRPEIYVQGNRNPYRISVDQKNSFLYWGEVGPDAANDSLDTRGPRGYDEVNQARKAGNFGWPLFVGNNYPYRNYDYTNGTSTKSFDPAKPINESRNNTGIQELPPVSPAFIWYPYAASPDFPSVGTGGRNAMAGPVFYSDMYPKETSLPAYYNGKLFIYEWIRGWIKVVTMKENGDFDKMEPFMPGVKFNSIIDMEMGPEGKIYLLEYGSGWFSKNPDAAISVIEYVSGNRAPAIASLSSNRSTGALPFTVKLSAEAKDPENDPMTYTWNLGDGTTKETTVPTLDYTYDKIGDYSVNVDIKDDKGASAKSETIQLYAGNETPEVSIALTGNKSFYFPGKKVNYSVSVADKDNPTGKTDPANLFISADYIEGTDLAGASRGHKQGEMIMSGKSLMLSLDCKVCHKEAEKSIGPAYTQVAEKYSKDRGARTYLIDKIIKGGSGVWGETAMAAHPNLSTSDADQIVRWILSLGNKGAIQKSLPTSGMVASTLDKPVKDNGVLSISASYTDAGGAGIKPLTGRSTMMLRNNKVMFTGKEKMKGFSSISFNGMNFMITPKPEGWLALDHIDLTDIGSVMIASGWQTPPQYGFDIELRLDGPDGQVIGNGSIVAPPGNAATKPGQIGGTASSIKITAPNDGKIHDLYITSKVKDPAEGGQVALQSVQFNMK